MNDLLAEMLDHYAITRTIAGYCRGVDRMDQAGIVDAYASESWDHHGDFRGSGEDFAESAIRIMQSGVSHHGSHMLGQTSVKLNGDEAGAETYFFATSCRPASDGREMLNQMGGRYVDRLVREDGAWKIKDRICVRDWSISLPVEEDWLKNHDFIQGERSRSDASYQVV